MFSPIALVILRRRVGRARDHRLHRHPLGARRRPAPRGLLPLGLVAAHARFRAGAVVRDTRRRLRRGDARARARRAAHQLPAVDLQRVPAPGAARRPSDDSGGRAAERDADDPRHHALNRLEALDDLWDDWETWFADVEETHTSQPSLVFFRSISHRRSWVTCRRRRARDGRLRAARRSTCPRTRRRSCASAPATSRCAASPTTSRSRTITTRGPTTRSASTAASSTPLYDELASFGVPVRTDREQCWQDYRGWRVNYDTVLLALAGLTMAPYAPWVSDRSLPYRRPPLSAAQPADVSPRRDARLLRHALGNRLPDPVQPLASGRPRPPDRPAAARSPSRSLGAHGRPAAATCASCTRGAR